MWGNCCDGLAGGALFSYLGVLIPATQSTFLRTLSLGGLSVPFWSAGWWWCVCGVAVRMVWSSGVHACVLFGPGGLPSLSHRQAAQLKRAEAAGVIRVFLYRKQVRSRQPVDLDRSPKVQVVYMSASAE